MSGWPILSFVTFAPLVGVAFILIARGEDAVGKRTIRWTALWTTIVTFLVSLLVWLNFNPNDSGFQLVERHEWLGGIASYQMGVDGISMQIGRAHV